jgi:hypothetical protein
VAVASSRPRWAAFGPSLSFAIAAAGVAAVAVFVWSWFATGHMPGDAVTYLAAGERLNAGHEIYRLLPGDAPVLMEPPYPPYPLLSPPLIAVLFRPLAILPDLAGAWLWWGAMALSLGAAIFALARSAPIVTGLVLMGLAFPIAVLIGVGNVDGLVIAGAAGAWVLIRRGRDTWAGALIGLLASLKLTPVVFAWWLIVHRRWRALLAFGATCVALAGMALLGSYPSVFVDYLGVIGAGFSSAPGSFSLAGLARGFGLSPEIAALMPRAAVVVGLAAIVLLRRQPALGFGICGALLWLGSPAAAAHTPALLLAALSPLIGRSSRGDGRPQTILAPTPQTSAEAQ